MKKVRSMINSHVFLQTLGFFYFGYAIGSLFVEKTHFLTIIGFALIWGFIGSSAIMIIGLLNQYQ